MNSVALVRYKTDITKSLDEGLAHLGGFDELKSPVLIKPNICTINDETGHSVTNISVVKALTNLILKVDEKLAIKIIESDSQSKNADDAFKRFGYNAFCREMTDSGFNVSSLNLSKEPLATVEFDGRYFKNPDLPRILTGPHYFISVAVAKTHYLAYITGAIKNLFGILPRKDKSFYHSKIHDVITDLARLIKPELSIIDARVGVEDWNGPKTHKIGAFILGKQPVSVDAVMTLIMGLDPQEVKHLINCKDYNLGSFSPEVVGETIKSLKVKFGIPKV